jgi:integrase
LGAARQRRDGRWELRTSNENRRVSFYGKTLAEARAKAKAAADRLPTRRRDALTVAEWLARWLEEQKPRLKPTAWLKYETFARVHIVPAIGKVQLDRLSSDDLNHLHRQILMRPTSGMTVVQGAHRTLSTSLSAAVKRGLVPTNIAKTVSAPATTPKRLETLTPMQVQHLLDAADAINAMYRGSDKGSAPSNPLVA